MTQELSTVDTYFGTVDYAVYKAYLDSGKKDRTLFKQFADNVMDVLPKTGTTLIKDAPLLHAKKNIMGVIKEFFALDDDIKAQFIFKDYNERGFVPYGMKKKQDYKEFFHVDSAIYKAMQGVPFDQIPDVIDATELTRQLKIGDHVRAWNETILDFTQKGREMGDALTEVMAYQFGFTPEYTTHLKDGNSLVRLLHYMAFDKEKLKDVQGATRADAHADIAAFTFLLTSNKPGLQVAPKQVVYDACGSTFVPNADLKKIAKEDWIDVPDLDDCCVMNIGRTSEIMSNGIYTATAHQVVTVPGQELDERFSVPFFYHFNWQANMQACDKAVALRGENFFEEKGPHSITIEDYVLRDEKRAWIEPTKPVPPYIPA